MEQGKNKIIIKKKTLIIASGFSKISRFEFPVEPNIINSLSSLSLFSVAMVAKNIDIEIVIIDSFGINNIV